MRGIFNSGEALRGEYAPEFSLIRSVLFDTKLSATSSAVPAGLTDPTSLPIPLTASATPTTSGAIDSGGLVSTLLAADPFVMEYAGGLPMDQVAWGQLSPEQLSQQTRIITALFALEMSPPYLNQLQSSNAASHILNTMNQMATGQATPGAFGDPTSKLVVINSSDAYVAGLASLLRVHWLLPGHQADYVPPSGNLVFELRQRPTGEQCVRVFFTSQTFDQMRNLTPLTLSTPPATMQLFIPGGSTSLSSLDIAYPAFASLLKSAINPEYVQNPATDTQPGVLTGVPLK